MAELVLVIDQFEEIFTLVEDEAERKQFLNSLVAAVQDPLSRLRVIVTLRADFYDRPLLYPGFGELVQVAYRSGAAAVVRRPARGDRRTRRTRRAGPGKQDW